jgi:hypothetical protein
VIVSKTDKNIVLDLTYSFTTIQMILKLVSIIIIIATAIIVVMKLCNKTLREHDDGRAARGSTVDKYNTENFSSLANSFS